MYSQFAFILSHPTHPGNIGACARAMKTMGFSRLILVNPKDYPCHQATAMASGAHDILRDALVVPSLSEALEPFHYSIGASARHRTLSWPMMDSRTMAENLVDKLSLGSSSCALVFGTESSGLTNEELSLCDHHVYIPTNEEYGSLNLSQAVQILAYELRMRISQCKLTAQSDQVPATYAQKEGFYQHIESTLAQLGILNPEHPRRLMGRVRRLFNRAEPDATEINILRGFLKAVQRQVHS